jgi:ZIP family zinc transporter
MAEAASQNVGLAFGLVCASGAATAVGAALVLFHGCVELASTRLLAACLGLSAGVMIYVSFGEILIKSQDAFVSSGMTPGAATAAATGCCFAGICLVALMHALLALCEGPAHDEAPDIPRLTAALEKEAGRASTSAADDKAADKPLTSVAGETRTQPAGSGAVAIVADVGVLSEAKASRSLSELEAGIDAGDAKASSSTVARAASQAPLRTASGAGDGAVATARSTLEDRKLHRTGVLAALALAGHNFPEGAATFVGALADPAVGIALATAIAIHNIPEGICVATTLYWSTGSRWKAFGWAVLSGVAEPVGALIVWLALQGTLSDVVYAVIFGLVAGMMIYISVKELLPTARRYDPEDKVTSTMVFLGMAVMALSLVLFVV